MIIYKVTNKINGKSYIGQTIFTLEHRKKCHIYDLRNSKYYFHKSLSKYGTKNFKWEVIDKCDNHDKLNQLEIFYIGYYDTFNNGYNLTTGGDGASGFIQSEEHKRKISESLKGRKLKPLTKEHKMKLSESHKGKQLSEKTKRKMSKSHKGKIKSKNHKINLSKSHKGKIKSEEHRRKIGEENKGKNILKKLKEK